VLSTCIRGVANNPKALLIGDSHAAQLNISAQLAGEKLGVGIEVLTASSCVPITGFNFAKLPQFAQQACKDQIAHVVPKIDQSKVVLLAAMWSYQFEDPLFESVVRKFLMQAIKDQKELLVFAQVPELAVNPQRVSRLSNLGFNLQVKQDTAWYFANKKLQKILDNKQLSWVRKYTFKKIENLKDKFCCNNLLSIESYRFNNFIKDYDF
jgi:hypothetical protein